MEEKYKDLIEALNEAHAELYDKIYELNKVRVDTMVVKNRISTISTELAKLEEVLLSDVKK